MLMAPIAAAATAKAPFANASASLRTNVAPIPAALPRLGERRRVADEPVLPALQQLDTALDGASQLVADPCDELDEGDVREPLDHGADGIDGGG